MPARASARRFGSRRRARAPAAAAAGGLGCPSRGNLYASLLLFDPAPAERVAQLSFVAALAVRDAIAEAAPALTSRLSLKWPNDVLLGGEKVAGILIEGEVVRGQPVTAVVGIGVNCVSHPSEAAFPATDLRAQGGDATPQSLMRHLAGATLTRLAQWDRGEGFARIRGDWLAVAPKAGEPIRVSDGSGERTGQFAGLDAGGRLLLDLADGKRQEIAAGDVFPLKSARGSVRPASARLKMAAPQQDLVFAPLGGVGEIGMNLSIYGLGDERHRQWLAVDLGVSFASEEHLPGIDLIFPDIRYLVAERKNLAGLVLTHAHEDHFGAVLDLWPQLKVPIYATPFTAALLAAKRASEPGAPDVPVTIVPLGGRFKVGPFDVELVSMAHSIPESNALIIRTPCGTVLHTGDWKIDPTPILGDVTDEKKLRALGEEGCLAIVGDSTNAVRDGRSPSEKDVAATIAELVKAARGRVAVTTFASNVARLRTVIDAAAAAGREVVVVGRAMDRMIQVARETGYLEGVQELRPVDAYGYLPPNKVVALCTGSQGEPRAALSRIAEDQHPDVTLSRGDTVIFSARTIPGNEKAVGRIINGLIDQGISVITDRTHLVHVSGHPRRAELEELIGWVKPKLLIPVHGEALHLSEHAALARRCGVKEVVQCRNGDLVRLAPSAGIIDEVPSGRLYKDGSLLVEADARTVADRKRLSIAGAVSIALALTDKGQLAADPELDLIGIPERDRDGGLMQEAVADAILQTFESLPRKRRGDPDAVAEAIRRAVRAAIAERWGKKPMCHVHVLTV